MIEVRCSITFFIILRHSHLHQHHAMQTALLMASLYSLGQDYQNEVQQDFFGHVTALAPASESHDVDGIVNITITFLILLCMAVLAYLHYSAWVV